MNLEALARFVISAGLILLIIGAALYGFARLNIPLGRLPGDIRIENDNGSFYFPVTTSILVSILLSILVNLAGRFWNK